MASSINQAYAIVPASHHNSVAPLDAEVSDIVTQAANVQFQGSIADTPSLRDLFLNSRHIDSLFDSFYAKRKILNKKIAVIALQVDGNGDLVFGLKLTKVLQERFPGNEITLFTLEKALPNVLKLCGKEFESVRRHLSPLPYKFEKEEFDLVIEGPVLKNQWEKLTSRQYKVLQLSEYGFGSMIYDESQPISPADQTFSTGLGKKELGIFAEPHPISPLPRTDELDVLQSQILKERLLGNKKSKDFLDSTSFYFGYSIYTATTFVQSVIGLADPAKNTVICLAGQNQSNTYEECDSYIESITTNLLALNKQELECLKKIYQNEAELSSKLSEIEELINSIEKRAEIKPQTEIENLAAELEKAKLSQLVDDFTNTLQGCLQEGNLKAETEFLQIISLIGPTWSEKNIDKVIFIDKAGNSHECILSVQRKEGRTLRIILTPPIEHMDMIRLNRAAQPLTICTDDQSMSDIVSFAYEGLSKIFIYETRSHKIDFFEDQMALARGFGKVSLFYESVRSQDADAIASLMKEEDFTKSFAEFTSSLISHHNLASNLDPKIRRMLVRDHQEEVNFFARMNHLLPSFYQPIVDDLD